MKSFRLYTSEPIAVPQRLAPDMPPDERARLREAFRPSARRYRRVGRIELGIFSAAIGFVLLGMMLPKPLSGWMLAGFMTCWCAILATFLLSPSLACPACANKLEQGFGPFCPECGAGALGPAGFFRAPHCAACGRDMRRGKGRHYRIRACTHCGLWLDDKGL